MDRVHLTHCNMGEEIGRCKYGDPDCPSLRPDSRHNVVLSKMKQDWRHAVYHCMTDSSFFDWSEEFGHRYWRDMLAEQDVEWAAADGNLKLCPFCNGNMTVGKNTAFHPDNKCWLATFGESSTPVEISDYDYASWNMRF